MLGSAKAETQLTIIEVTEHDLFLSPGVIPSQYGRVCSAHHNGMTSVVYDRGQRVRLVF